MSKTIASESNEDYEGREMSRKRGEKDEGNEDGDETLEVPTAESLPISTVVSTVPTRTDQFMHTPEFRRHFVDFVHVETLMVLRVARKVWNTAADAKIDEGVRSRAIIVHDRKDKPGILFNKARQERRKLATRVIFLLNITKVGDWACRLAVNLVVVDIPEGIESIGVNAFLGCNSLTAVSFPTTLIYIGEGALHYCSSLVNVDLLHTNLQELGRQAFQDCSELKLMTIPDSLQTLGENVFYGCSKLVPSNIDVDAFWKDITSEVITHLRSQQLNKKPH